MQILSCFCYYYLQGSTDLTLVVVLALMVVQFEKSTIDYNGHVTEQPQIKEEKVGAVYYKVVYA